MKPEALDAISVVQTSREVINARMDATTMNAQIATRKDSLSSNMKND